MKMYSPNRFFTMFGVATAGMTSGCMIIPLMYGLWDRLRPPGINSICMQIFGVILQTSLTHGFLPYGSSDLLLPSFVALVWTLELTPRYGGPVDDGEYRLWWQCFFACFGGMVLRLADIKRTNPKAFAWCLRGFFFICVAPFGLVLGPSDPVLVGGLLAGVIVANFPARGHIFWHVGSAYALFIWWYLLRVRPGNPESSSNRDTTIFSVLLLVAVRNAVRRLFMVMPFSSSEHRDRTRSALEHGLFALWGYYCLVLLPTHDASAANEAVDSKSWLLNPNLCWTLPSYPSSTFRLFFLAKVAFYIEQLAYFLVRTCQQLTGALLKEAGESRLDLKEEIQHAAAGVLCLTCFLAGFPKIGSILLFFRDLSDLPMALFRTSVLLGWRNAQRICRCLAIGTWIYWRFWKVLAVPIWSTAFSSRSLVQESKCVQGFCTWAEVPERLPLLLLFFSMLLVDLVSFSDMLSKRRPKARTPHVPSVLIVENSI